MMAYVSLLNSPGDDLRLKRIINEPKRKIGTATVEAIEDIAHTLGVSMYDVICRADEFSALSKSREKLSEFVRIMEDVKSNVALPSEQIKALFERTGYMAMLRAEGFEGESKIENVGEFISAAVEFEARCALAETEPTLTGFLEEITLVADVDKYDEDADAVVLMTVHSAKGLEFDCVILMGASQGMFPRNYSDDELRCMYVALTRARYFLFVTSPVLVKTYEGLKRTQLPYCFENIEDFYDSQSSF
jgi:DNA helicase-2/ATP-dependent DNA helicase PcrA